MQVMMREGLARNAVAPKFIGDPLDAYAPEQIASRIGIAADSLVRIAREFAKAEKPLALSGDNSDVRVVDHLNVMVANVNKPGGVLLNDSGRPDPLGALRRAGSKAWISSPLINAIDTDAGDVLFLHRVNPAHTDPRTIESLRQAPFIVSFAPVLDETALMADLILPDRSYLESWDIQASILADKRTAVTLTQPVIKPEPGTMQAADALLALAAELGGTPLPFKSAEEAVKQAAGALQKAGGSITAESPEDFMTAISTQGVWSGEVPAKSPSPEMADRPLYGMKASQTDPAYPLTLLTYEHAALGTGGSANLPMLQELPDPMTTVMWGSWVEINPKTAHELGIGDGDLVEVRTPHHALRVAAVVYPAIRPDTIAMPLGQGHTSFGRYARGTGANAETLWGPNDGLGPVAAAISKVSGEGKLIRFGTSLPEHFDRKR
jgi:anaerobic selenocysteine-containing dehydrogenase